MRTPLSADSNRARGAPLVEPQANLKRKCATDKHASRAQEASEYQIFGNLVARKLQKYSAVAQTAVQEAIMSILFKADRGYYDPRVVQGSSLAPP